MQEHFFSHHLAPQYPTSLSPNWPLPRSNGHHRSHTLDDNPIPVLAILWYLNNLVNRNLPHNKPGLLYNLRLLWYCPWVRTGVSASFFHVTSVRDLGCEYFVHDVAGEIFGFA